MSVLYRTVRADVPNWKLVHAQALVPFTMVTRAHPIIRPRGALLCRVYESSGPAPFGHDVVPHDGPITCARCNDIAWRLEEGA